MVFSHPDEVEQGSLHTGGLDEIKRDSLLPDTVILAYAGGIALPLWSSLAVHRAGPSQMRYAFDEVNKGRESGK